MADIGWARSRGGSAEKEGLRRGAWYRIVEESGKSWMVLDVHQVEVRVPKENVDIRKDRPKAWSVVDEPHLVCPGCHILLGNAHFDLVHVDRKSTRLNSSHVRISYAV